MSNYSFYAKKDNSPCRDCEHRAACKAKLEACYSFALYVEDGRQYTNIPKNPTRDTYANVMWVDDTLTNVIWENGEQKVIGEDADVDDEGKSLFIRRLKAKLREGIYA
jgi:hypothetical protein